MLPYFEQANKFNQFDLTQNVNTSASNAAARTQDLPILLCPSDGSQGTIFTPPAGRTNYLANLGAHAWWRNPDGSTGGTFRYTTDGKSVKFADITDGTSNTALFCEIKRGNNPARPELRVMNIPYPTWDANLAVNDRQPDVICTNTGSYFDYTGLQYYRALIWTAWYTHTAPPNYKGTIAFAASALTGPRCRPQLSHRRRQPAARRRVGGVCPRHDPARHLAGARHPRRG